MLLHNFIDILYYNTDKILKCSEYNNSELRAFSHATKIPRGIIIWLSAPNPETKDVKNIITQLYITAPIAHNCSLLQLRNKKKKALFI